MSDERSPLRHWALYIAAWLFGLAMVASAVLFCVALFVWGSWILGLIFTAIMAVWIRQIVIQSNIAALVRSFFAKPS